jgi:hypothetical protein
LVGYSYIDAQWVGPTEGPTFDNVPAPLNVGPIGQIKEGALGLDALAVFGSTYVSATATVQQINSPLYCDESGANCVEELFVGFKGMYSLQSDDCSYPNPATGDCTCPPGSETYTLLDFDAVTGTSTQYSVVQCWLAGSDLPLDSL